jgi:cation:H+ antiporter
MTTFLLNSLLLIVGFILLIKGADFLVENSSILARSMGISPMTIGITIVAFGTSLPEFLISLIATISGEPDLNIGNVVGSNICNIALVLGTSALFLPIVVRFKVLLKEMPIVVIISIIFTILLLDGVVDTLDSAIQLIAFSFFMYFSIKGDGIPVEIEEDDVLQRSKKSIFFFILMGIVGVMGGAQLVVESAISIAKSYNVPEAIIGATIVALGTSLPELVTSVVAAWKGECDISLGNVLGSNIFNIAFIPSVIALIQPIKVGASLIKFDIWVMLFLTIILYPLIIARLRISKVEGIFLLLCYLTYNVILFKSIL